MGLLQISDIDAIESIQRYFTKRIIGCSHLLYVERLKKLNLPSLSYRRMRGDMIEVFKIFQHMIGVNVQ